MLLQRFQEETDKGPRKQKILQDFDNEKVVKAVSSLFKSDISHDMFNTVYQTPVQVEYIPKRTASCLKCQEAVLLCFMPNMLG
jgi:hypothetical protein